MDAIEEELELSEILNEIVNDLIEDYDPNSVAAMLMINAFMIYGHILPKDEYKEFMLDIFNNSEQFSGAKRRTLH